MGVRLVTPETANEEIYYVCPLLDDTIITRFVLLVIGITPPTFRQLFATIVTWDFQVRYLLMAMFMLIQSACFDIIGSASYSSGGRLGIFSQWGLK